MLSETLLGKQLEEIVNKIISSHNLDIEIIKQGMLSPSLRQIFIPILLEKGESISDIMKMIYYFRLQGLDLNNCTSINMQLNNESLIEVINQLFNTKNEYLQYRRIFYIDCIEHRTKDRYGKIKKEVSVIRDSNKFAMDLPVFVSALNILRVIKSEFNIIEQEFDI